MSASLYLQALLELFFILGVAAGPAVGGGLAEVCGSVHSHSDTRTVVVASFPGLPRFVVLRFSFSIIHGSGRAQETGKAWEHLSRE